MLNPSTCGPLLLSKSLFQSTVYYILVMISGLFLGFIWGLLFGSLVFIINWIIHPIYKMMFLLVRLVGMIYRPNIRTITDPLFESAGLCLKSIKGSVEVKLPRWPVAGCKTDCEVIQVRHGSRILDTGVAWKNRHNKNEYNKTVRYIGNSTP